MLLGHCRIANDDIGLQVSRVTERWKEEREDIRESMEDVEDNVARVEDDCKAKGVQIDMLSNQGWRNSNFIS